MIRSIRHKGLKRFYESGNASGIRASHSQKLREQLVALDTAKIIDDLNLPGYRLHLLRGDRKDIWSISINRNWRLTFEFDNGNVYLLDYEDYH
jgi:proteic killer suppression protein